MYHGMATPDTNQNDRSSIGTKFKKNLIFFSFYLVDIIRAQLEVMVTFRGCLAMSGNNLYHDEEGFYTSTLLNMLHPVC